MKFISALILLLIFSSTSHVFSQEKSAAEFGKPKKNPPSQNKCEMYGKPDFAGGVISLYVVNADIRDILNYITEEHGVNFVIDKSIKQVPITVKVSNAPWNIALDSILKANGLVVHSRCPNLFIAENQVPFVHNETLPPLFTEIIKLENLNLSEGGCGLPGERAAKFIKRIRVMFSHRGALEIDVKSNSIIVTDVKNRVKSISDFVRLLDGSGFTLEELTNKF